MVSDMVRYTRLYTNGQAYISVHKVRLSPSGNEIVGEPIQRFALYEASGYEPAEILMSMRELDAYRKTGFTPDQLSRIFKNIPTRQDRGCPGQLSLSEHGV